MNNMLIPICEFPVVALHTYITEASVIHKLMFVSNISNQVMRSTRLFSNLIGSEAVYFGTEVHG